MLKAYCFHILLKFIFMVTGGFSLPVRLSNGKTAKCVRYGSDWQRKVWHGSSAGAAAQTLLVLILNLGVSHAYGAEKLHDIELSASTVAESLNRLSEQTGVPVLFSYDMVEGKKAQPVKGKYSLHQALELLLADTGLTGSLSKKGVVLIASRQSPTETDKKRKDAMKTRKSTFATILLSIFGTSQITLAQSGDTSSKAIEEIIVTAQKRSENMQDVPIAITAHTAETLENLRIANSDDLSIAVPGLQITRQADASTAFIRGVGNNNGSSGNEPSVPIYVDGVYNPFMRANVMEFNNIDRIEVLKGPQGTLFGRNATGGIIHVITKTPSADPGFKASVGYGSYDTVETAMYGTTGFGENVTGDLALVYKDRDDGYITNTFLDKERGVYKNFQLRSKWLITPSDKTTITATGFYGDDEGDYGMSRSFVDGSKGLDGTVNDGNFYHVAMNFDEYFTHETWGLSTQIEHDFDGVTLVSVTGYQEVVSHFRIDQDTTPLPVIDAPIKGDDDAFTQEIRLLSTGDRNINWIAGLFFFNYDASYAPLRIAGLAAGRFNPIDVFSEVNTKSVAAFGEANWKITDRSKLTVGLRYTEDDLEMNGRTLFAGNAFFPDFQDDTTFNEVTYRVTIDHSFSDDVMGYASISRGYKAGVYNLVVTDGNPKPALDPEIVDSYEVGFKSDLNDQKIRLNGSLFYADYSDLQLSTLSSGAITTINAPSVEVYGGELELSIAATDRLSMQFGLSYLNGEYVNFEDGPLFPRLPQGGNDSTVSADLSGNNIIRSPEWSSHVMLNYLIPTNIGNFEFNTIAAYTGDFYWDPNNRIKEDNVTTLNAQFSWQSIDEIYRLSIWGKNLLDNEYSIYSIAQSFGDNYTPAEPITYGVRIEMNFQ